MKSRKDKVFFIKFSIGEFYCTFSDFGPGCYDDEDDVFRGDNEDTDFWEAMSCSNIASCQRIVDFLVQRCRHNPNLVKFS